MRVSPGSFTVTRLEIFLSATYALTQFPCQGMQSGTGDVTVMNAWLSQSMQNEPFTGVVDFGHPDPTKKPHVPERHDSGSSLDVESMSTGGAEQRFYLSLGGTYIPFRD